MKLRLRQRITTTIVLLCFIFVFVVVAVAVPRPTHAQLSVQDLPLETAAGVEPIRLSWSNAIVASAATGLISAIQLFAQTFAYDLAAGLASGFKGQNPFAFLDDPGTYFTSVAFSAAGEFIGNLRGPWEFLGLDLCSPRIPDIGLAIALGLAEQFQRPTPKCDFARTINNWRNVAREASDPHALLKHLNLAFDAGQTDLGQALKAQEAFRIEIVRQEKAAEQKRDEGGGILPQEGIISGRVKTPAAELNENFRELTKKGKENQPTVGNVIGATLGSGDVWVAVGSTVLSTFVNTLLARSLRLALEGLFSDSPGDPLPDLLSLVGGTLPPPGDRRPPGLSPLASTLLATPPRTATGAFEYLSELAACPRNPAVASQFNCTIDTQFMVAIQSATTGKPMTVNEAVEKGYLNRSRAFGFTNPVSSGPTQPPREPTLSEGYAYSSMKKLRLLRIIPIGWELAAERINTDDQTATLGDVLDGWDKEGDSPGCQGFNADGSPRDATENRFCGLVDPNWVLKGPLAQCGAQVFSSILDASGLSRQENCADIKHCIADDGSGSCDGWGYCTREKNIWRFDGDSCLEQYVSCDTFKAEVKGAQAVSLLENTVDFGVCSAENAGCTGYLSREEFAADDTLSWDDGSARLYLDRDAPVCSAALQGCSEIILATPELNALIEDGTGEGAAAGRRGSLPDEYPSGVERQHYRLPPEYLGCTGEEGQPAQCGNFSRICRAEEAGCESYTPSGSSAQGSASAISGIVTALDICPSECVGYDTYVKLGSRFEPQFTAVALGALWAAGAPEENLYPLIPTNALSCNAQEVGCEEFTNLRTEQREYYSEVRACQQPATDSQTYFTWEGSDTSGYQLKTWSFKRSQLSYTDDNAFLSVEHASGSAFPPCTNYAIDVSADGNIQVNCTDTDTNQAVCDPADETLTEGERANCRAFYDEFGNIFHRFLTRTIVSTDECQAMRWTGLPALPEILPQADIDETTDELRGRLEQASCEDSHGFWNTTTSECLYLTAPSLSASCRPQAYGCRAFKGNTAGNTEDLLTESFEGSTALMERGWLAALGATMSISSEALNVGEHSLRVENADNNEGVSRTFGAGEELPADFTYFARLNVKGTTGTQLRVALGTEELGVFELTPEWRYQELGPLVLTAVQDTLEFKKIGGVGTDVFYLDDISLVRTQDTLYLIKYGWDVPISCDLLPQEAGGGYARGAMLGCRAYTDRAGEAHELKSFASLCRDVAVGCSEIIDTRNSEAIFAQSFNETNSGICRGEPGVCRVDTNGDGVVRSEAPDIDEVVCTVPDGATTCQYGPSIDNEDGSATADNLPVDDWAVASDTRKFVVIDEQFACQAAQKGCSALGRQAAGGAVETVYLRNDPERYNVDLCSQEALGCQAWTRSDRSAAYFKDPGVNGCSFKTNVQIGAGQYSGWFRDEKQPVFVSNPPVVPGISPATLEVTELTESRCEGWGTWNFSTSPGQCIDSDGNTVTSCGGIPCDASLCARGAAGSWVEDATAVLGGRCVSDAPCYGTVEAYDARPGSGLRPALRIDVSETYLAGGSSFGIWRNADANFAGRAGSCPQAEATCTAFVDPTDKSREGEEATYYFKDNARLQLARSDCDGKVSRSEGCALFRAVEDPTLRYWAQQSYLLSDNTNNAAVSPVSLATENDTNTILKVTRDRVCSEWFQCASAQWFFDEQAGRMVTSCRQLGRCNELATSPAVGNTIGTCSGWVREPNLGKRPQTDAVACVEAGFTWDAEQEKCLIEEEEECTNLGGIWHPDPDGVGPQSARCVLGRVRASTYLLRDRTFSGQEYLGYTVPNIYAVTELTEVDIGSGEECSSDRDCLVGDYNFANHICKDGRCSSPRLAHIVAGATCAPGTGQAGCLESAWCTTDGRCAVAPTGERFDGTTTDEIQCRGFAERDAPFANTQLIRDSNVFSDANKCLENGSNCVCDYTKAEFSGGNIYLSPAAASSDIGKYCFGTTNPETGAPLRCVQGVGNNVTTITEASCSTGCQSLTKINKVLGWRGYCLDRDGSRNINADPAQNPCLTWFPVDQLSSQGDLYNQDVEAAYTVPAEGGKYYCLFGREIAGREVFDLAAQTTAGDKVRVRTENVESENIFLFDIQRVEVKISGTGAADAATVSGPMSSVYAMDFGKEHTAADRILLTNNWWAYDMNPNGSDFPDDSEWLWWAGDDNGSSSVVVVDRDNTAEHGTGDPTPEPRLLAWGLSAALEHLPLEDNQNLEVNENVVFDDISSTNSALFDNGDDSAAVLLHFNSESRKLTHVRLGVFSEEDRSALVRATVTIFLHPHCEVIAGIDTAPGAQKSAPFTNTLRGSVSTVNVGTSDTVYEKDKQYSPYGSSASQQVPSASAGHPWFFNHNGLDLPTEDGDTAQHSPFAGHPWGCALQTGFVGVGSVENCTLEIDGESVDVPHYSDVVPPPAIEDFARKLFAKSDRVFRWRSTGGYADQRRDTLWHWDERLTATLDSLHDVPQFLAPGSSNPVGSVGDTLGEPISINGVYDGQVEGVNGFLLANLEWHMWADPDHMPIKTWRLDLNGDGSTIITGEGLYKNYKPDEECRGDEFGNQIGDDGSCVEDSYRYEHLYSCGGPEDPYWSANLGRECPVSDFEEIYGGCCVFKPKVQATDNWGFCNGTCDGDGNDDDEVHDGGYCFENECSATSIGAWSEFAGEVIVAP